MAASKEQLMANSAGGSARMAGPLTAQQPPVLTDFLWDNETFDWHAQRRTGIIESHPEVSKLQGPEWKSKYLCLLAVLPQIWLSVATMDLPWIPYLVIAYVAGATMTQANFLAHHELSHNLFFKSPLANRLYSFFANLPLIVAFTITFRAYHQDHHKFLTVDGHDTDVPSRLEARLIQSRLGKAIWAQCQILTYAFRPALIKSIPLSRMLAANWAIQLAFNYALFHFYGPRPLQYLALCVFLAGGIHPCAGHFISEHYVFPSSDVSQPQETSSYYGPLNRVTWNVGYHNEHHDFPYIPWSKLPALKALAPEFYDHLQAHDSWCRVIWDYIMRPDMGPYSRVKRPYPEGLKDE